ncbi:T9SS type A sorting domain-containing protein [Portibacter lacus]|uniref:Secretion system C-terminal sorting domain-containing protein n=1 Tax=Portibacter lacus TaxID=1099794 RepID=A0AA37SYB4_9BACT|nr:T9SS type A sorting domain-containing protein [Portibacter lacus]GLR19818.1 hypothetical protein GCM10007940_44340 [Portibacter lacus]
MNKVIYTVLAIFILSISANAQSELIIEPGAPGVINSAIEGDTMATGERVDSNRVYILRRGFPYILSGTIEYSDYNLIIKSEDTDGEKPFVIMDSDGDAADQMIRTRGEASLTLDGLHISAKDILGGYTLRVIRINSDNSNIIVKNCIIDDVGQAAVRIQGDNGNIQLTNNVFRNIGRPFDPANGRVFDNRGNPVDTLLMENNVFYNVTSRVYRDGGSSSLGYAKINQNTIWGTGRLGMTFGEISSLEFTNNIYANGMFLGVLETDQDTAETAEFQISIDTFDASVNTITVSNNNFYTDQGISDLFPLTNVNGENVVSAETYLFNPEVQAAIDAAGNGDTNISEELEFTKAPSLPLQFINAVATDTSSSGVPTAENWDLSDLESDADLTSLGTGSDIRYREVHDFGYPTTAVSYTAGTEGQPIGSLTEVSSSTSDYFVENNVLFYPNPVSQRLYVQNLRNSNLHQVNIYNLNGQLVKQIRNIDHNILEINTSNFANGTYILSLIDTRGNVSSQKFMKQ